MNKPTKDLISAYKKIRPEIRRRLSEFSPIHKSSDEKIFSEMCYCILTANANALKCNEAIGDLEKKGFLLKGEPRHIRPLIKGKARFHNKKAEYIVGARKLFERDGTIDIKSKLNPRDILNVREWLVENIKGFGYKEASHFLRNIGLGKNIAILDRHILKNLQKYSVIDKIPSSLGSRRVYLEIEDKMKGFSKKTGIPLEDMDLLFWSLQTGFVFK
ncbi:MAG: N-glycosylase/DNA lyase [Candidatus Omnitrophota bacterium]